MIKNNLKAIGMLVTALFCLIAAQTVRAQNLQKQYGVINRSISEGSDGGSIHLNEMQGVGIAWIKGMEFKQGTIEFDVRGKDELQRSFVGIAFHGSNDTTYESVYFRPFNFQAADPVRKSHSVQYIAMPNYDWPKLRADYPDKYEQPVSPAPDPNQWFHVHIVVETKKISVYVNDNKQASLIVEPLVNVGGKMIGFWVGNNSGGDWKNFKIEE